MHTVGSIRVRYGARGHVVVPRSSDQTQQFDKPIQDPLEPRTGVVLVVIVAGHTRSSLQIDKKLAAHGNLVNLPVSRALVEDIICLYSVKLCFNPSDGHYSVSSNSEDSSHDATQI
jgi:hypothetical protein